MTDEDVVKVEVEFSNNRAIRVTLANEIIWELDGVRKVDYCCAIIMCPTAAVLISRLIVIGAKAENIQAVGMSLHKLALDLLKREADHAIKAFNFNLQRLLYESQQQSAQDQEDTELKPTDEELQRLADMADLGELNDLENLDSLEDQDDIEEVEGDGGNA